MTEGLDTIMKRPFEVDVSEYPFKDNWLSYRDGYIHYLDEGKGPTVLLLHGNPTWSYIYRNIIKELRGECRLIALDYPGFGMSKAPSQYGFTPKEQSEAVLELIHRLELKNIILVVQDWGGPSARASKNILPCDGRMAYWVLASNTPQLLCKSDVT